MNRRSILLLFCLTVFSGCYRFTYDDPVGPNTGDEEENPASSEPEDSSAHEDSLNYEDFVSSSLPSKILYSPYNDGPWNPVSGHDLYLLDPVTKEASLILSRRSGDFGFQWLASSADGKRIAFSSQDSVRFGSVGWGYRFSLTVFSADQQTSTLVDSSIERSLIAPDFSSDGRIVYNASNSAEGDEIRIDGNRLFGQPYVLLGTPKWNQDNSRILVSIVPMDPTNPNFRMGIYSMDPSSGRTTPLVTDTSSFLPSGEPAFYFFGPSLSSDGLTMLFFISRMDHVEIWTMNTNGTNPQFVGDFPSWAIITGLLTPDGKNIMFGAPERNAVFLLNLARKTETRILDPYGTFAWVK